MFQVYWALGAVLNVPFLAGGELMLLVRDRTRAGGVLDRAGLRDRLHRLGARAARRSTSSALAADLPSGKHVFGEGSAAHRLPQLISIPSYLVLVAGALWSAWRMRGRPELRDRFVGTLLIALGATVIAGFGSASRSHGRAAAFSVALAAGIAVMFAGFLRAADMLGTGACPCEHEVGLSESGAGLSELPEPRLLRLRRRSSSPTTTPRSRGSVGASIGSIEIHRSS